MRSCVRARVSVHACVRACVRALDEGLGGCACVSFMCVCVCEAALWVHVVYSPSD
jgi:hypothetical protein